MARKIFLDQINQSGATTDDVIKWDGTKWAPGEGGAAPGDTTETIIYSAVSPTSGKFDITGLDLTDYSSVEIELIGFDADAGLRPIVNYFIDGAGSPDTTAGNYTGITHSYSSGDNQDVDPHTGAIQMASATSAPWYVDGTVTDARYSGILRIHGPNSTGHRAWTLEGVVSQGSTGSTSRTAGGGVYKASGAITGLRITNYSGDNLTSGAVVIRGRFSVTGGTNGLTDGDKGDIVTSAGGSVWTIDNGAVSLAKMANLAANSFIGNNTGSAATPIALTGTQATTLLDAFTSSLKGLAPASGGGTTNFLRADGTWAEPPGGGGGVSDGDKGDVVVSSSGTVWTVDTMTGANGTDPGAKGLVPAPAATDNLKFLRGDGTWQTSGGGGTWGSITGTLSSQSDLQTALDNKLSISAIVNGVEGFCSGMPDVNEVVGGNIAPNSYTLSALNSIAKSLVAATASTVFDIKKNGVSIGSVTFAAAASTASVSYTNTSISAGDMISIHAPSSQDLTLSGVAFLLRN